MKNVIIAYHATDDSLVGTTQEVDDDTARLLISEGRARLAPEVQPYDNGGELPSGMTIETNDTGEAIPVLTSDQVAAESAAKPPRKSTPPAAAAT